MFTLNGKPLEPNQKAFLFCGAIFAMVTLGQMKRNAWLAGYATAAAEVAQNATSNL
jgi:hypothetical protein